MQTSGQLVDHIREEYKQFAYKVSHDLSAPLRQSSGFARIVLEKNRKQLDPKSVHYLELIEKGASKAQAMLAGLLLYSRLNTSPLQYDYIDITATIRKCLFSLEKEIHSKSALVEFNATGKYRADQSRVDILIYELLKNSLTYCVPNQAPYVEINVEQQPNGFVIEVQDNGPGIPETKWELVLRPLTSLDEEKYGIRSGMGLAIAKKVTEQHHGTIERMPSYQGTVIRATLRT